MPNRITITFEPCTPTPPGGYDLYYKIKGSSQPMTFGGNFPTSPASVVVIGTPGTRYEGYIQSKCNGVNGKPVPWAMLTDGTNNAEFAESTTLADACEQNSYITLFYVGNLENGAVLYTDLFVTTHYTAKPFLRTHSGIIYQVNQATGQITQVSAC